MAHICKMKVRDVQSVPVLIREDKPLYDAVVATFLEDVGTLFVVNSVGALTGAVSRSDLLRSSIGQMDLEKVPVGVIMTRMANIITLSPDESLLSAARKLWLHRLTALPVVRQQNGDGHSSFEVTGVISLSTITRIFAELGETS
ncbi:MAG: CBS domain-containing protein [bacterium]|nr:CBS domain-containing protein [bacterium]